MSPSARHEGMDAGGNNINKNALIVGCASFGTFLLIVVMLLATWLIRRRASSRASSKSKSNTSSIATPPVIVNATENDGDEELDDDISVLSEGIGVELDDTNGGGGVSHEIL